MLQPLWKTVWRFLRKLKTELPYDPEIPFLGTWMCAKSPQSCPALCDPVDGSPLGPLSTGFSRQEYRNGLPRPPPGGSFLELESPTSPVLTGRFFTTSATQEAPFPGHISRQNSNPKGYVHTNVNSSTIHNSQDMEASMSTDTHEWRKKMWHIFTTEYYSAINRNTLGPILMRWVNLEPIVQSEVSRQEKDKYILMHMYGI